jgi:hypothetical protein
LLDVLPNEHSIKRKRLLYKDELPASVMEELALEVSQLKAQIRAQAAAAQAYARFG